MALMHEEVFTLGGIFALAGFVVEEFYCIFGGHGHQTHKILRFINRRQGG